MESGSQKIGNAINPIVPLDHASEAHLVSRIFAYCVDFGVVTVLVFAALSVWKLFGGSQPVLFVRGADMAGLLMYITIGGIYDILMWLSPRSATFGKMLVRIRVATADGGRLSLREATTRYVARLLSVAVLGIGFLRALVADDRLTLHDVLAGTCVMRSM